MRSLVPWLLLLLAACAHAPVPAVHDEVPRGRAFWLALRDSKFELPAGVTRAEVLRDAVALVDAAEPLLRDDVGYGLAVQWVYRDGSLPPAELEAWTKQLLERMTHLPDERVDSVVGRSFAALSLSLVAAAEQKQPRLGPQTFEALVAAAASQLERERDLRGYDARLGWVHATAHTADLLKFLARDARLSAAQQERVRASVMARLEQPAPLAWGEDERLAAVLRSLALRSDADLGALQRWAETVGARWRALWDAPRFDPDEFQRLNASRQVLRALLVSLPAEADALAPFRASALAAVRS